MASICLRSSIVCSPAFQACGIFSDGGFVIAGQRVEAQVDAGRQHQAVVAERTAVGETDAARLRIDLCGGLRDDVHAFGGDPS